MKHEPARATAPSPALGVLAAYRGLQTLRDKAFSLAIRSSFRAFGAHTVIQPPLRVYGWKGISVGSKVFIGSHCWIVALDSETADMSTIEIGDGTHIAGLCVISAAVSVRLGRSVLFGRNVHVADHSHAYTDPSRPVLAQGITDVQPVEIGDGAWLGNNVVVTSGVRIGSGAVVGANAVVRGDVPDFSLAVGAPARVVRTFR